MLRSLFWCLTAAGLAGSCVTDSGLSDKPSYDFCVVCPPTYCNKILTIDFDDLVSCYGWDPVTGWGPDTPPEILESCPVAYMGNEFPSDVCGVWLTDIYFSEIDSIFVPTESNCGQIPEDISQPNDCCVPPEVGFRGQDWEEIGGELLISLESVCNIDLAEMYGETGSGCTPPGADGPGLPALEDASVVECDLLGLEDEYMHAPGSEYFLNVNGLESFVRFTPSSGPATTASVWGGGAIGTGPAEFLSGKIWVDPATYAGTAYTGWRFWFATPIAMNFQTGTFSVPAQQASDPPMFEGAGTAGSSATFVKVGLPTSATGVLDAVNETWYLDYTRSASGQPTVTVHLEGILEEAPPPPNWLP